MDRSTFPKPGGARPDVSQCKKLGNRTRVSKETCRGESDAPQDELKNLDGTKTEQLVKSVKDKLRSEMNGRLQGMVKHLQILEESIRGESEAPQDKLTNLGGTKMEQFVKSVEDKLRSEMNALYEGMVTQLQFLEESLRRESEALQGKLRNLDGTEMEQLVKSVEDKLTSEMNDQFECMRNYLQFLKEILRGESDGPQDKLTNLDGTKMEQLVNSVEDKLISEMNGRFQHMLKHLQFLKERFRGESKAPEDKLTYLDGTKMEQLVKCVEDKLTSEMNERFECIRNHLQCLKEILSTKLLGRRWWCCCHFYAGKASNELTLIPNTSVPYRGESDGPQDKLTNLDGTKMEQLVNSVEDTLTSEMNALYEGMVTQLQFLEESLRGESEAPQDELTNLGGTRMEQRVKYVEDKLREMKAQFEGAEKRLEVLQERLSQEAASETDCCGSRSQEVSNNSQCFAQNPGLESVSANAMRSHKFSENLNDPCQEADVLEMYNGLRTHEWEKAKCAANGSAFPMTYEKGSTIIKAVFSICEKDLSQRLEQIFELLEIPVSKKTTSLFDSQQLPPGLAREIKNHLKHRYFNYGEDFYQVKSRPSLPPDLQKFQPLVHFTAECYKIYCLLLLQNPPIKAVWPTDEKIPISCIQHVDNKNVEDRMPLNFLWPVLACGRLVFKKAVIYD
ncbi:uncharacterized protein ACDP82_019158 isoform 25-T26 [Pangshura tecta]